MPTPLAQPALSGGELSPTLYGRVDLERYGESLALCENFVVNPHGGVYNRPGTRYIGTTKEQSQYVRLIAFVPSTAEQYVLEFGPLYLRIYDATTGLRLYDDAAVLIELTTPYLSGAQDNLGSPNEISELVVTQSVDVMTIVHPNHSPMELKRNTRTYWTLTPLAHFVNYGQPQAVTEQLPSPTGSPKRDWQYAVSGVTPDGVESLATLSPVLNVFMSSTQPVTLLIRVGSLVDHYVVYKGLNGTYGFIGTVYVNSQAALTAAEAGRQARGQAYQAAIAAGASTDAALAAGYAAEQAAIDAVSQANGITPGVTQFAFKDDNIAPDYTDQPRQAVNPFTPTGGLRPACVAYFQQRLAFANVAGRPDTIYLSEVADYKNFQRQIPTSPDDSIVATIAAPGLNAIRAMVPLRHLLIFTAGAEYLFGAEEGATTPDNVDAVPQSYRGSAPLQPLLVGGIVVFKDIGGHVREWVYDQNQNGYPSADIGILASHLFDGHQIVAWAYASSPDSIIWAVRDDGMLLSLTYIREHSIAGWARHASQGKFRSVCAVRKAGDSGESLWCVVDRTIGGGTVKMIEAAAPRDDDTSPFSDASLALSVPNSGTATFIPDAGSPASGWLKGATIRILTPGFLWFFNLADARWIWLYTAAGERIHARLTGISTGPGGIGFSNTGVFELGRDVPIELRSVSITGWKVARQTWTGLSHLALATVAVRADGVAHPNVVVAADGTITLNHPAVEIVVGLPYESTITTLSLASPQQEIRAKQKLITSVSAVVNATRGLFMGMKDGELDEVKMRDLGPPGDTTGIVSTSVSSTWERNGQVVLKQTYPLPCQVLSIIPEVTVGG